MDLQLKDRVVLVVGGAGYIGSAISARLRDEGAKVVVGSRSGSGDVVIDGSDEASVSAAIDQVVEQYGRLDGVVVTAAPAAQTLDTSRLSDPAQVLDAVDGKAMVFLRIANAAIPVMRQSGFGRIVVISGQNAYLTGNITGSVRNAATALVAKNLADELAGTGVAVNVVNPGAVTDEPAAEVHPGKGGESSPRQIADLVAFLSSPLSAVSGESISIGHRVLGVASL